LHENGVALQEGNAVKGSGLGAQPSGQSGLDFELAAVLTGDPLGLTATARPGCASSLVSVADLGGLADTLGSRRREYVLGGQAKLLNDGTSLGNRFRQFGFTSFSDLLF